MQQAGTLTIVPAGGTVSGSATRHGASDHNGIVVGRGFFTQCGDGLPQEPITAVNAATVHNPTKFKPIKDPDGMPAGCWTRRDFVAAKTAAPCSQTRRERSKTPIISQNAANRLDKLRKLDYHLIIS